MIQILKQLKICGVWPATWEAGGWEPGLEISKVSDIYPASTGQHSQPKIIQLQGELTT